MKHIKQEQATAYQTVTGNITTLTTFKTTIETALTDGGYENFAAVFYTAKRTGGDMTQVLQKVARMLGDKIEVKKRN